MAVLYVSHVCGEEDEGKWPNLLIQRYFANVKYSVVQRQ